MRSHALPTTIILPDLSTLQPCIRPCSISKSLEQASAGSDASTRPTIVLGRPQSSGRHQLKRIDSRGIAAREST